jgi:hypothetical protein
MKVFCTCLTFLALSASSFAADTVSAYTQINLSKCLQTQKADEQVFEGAWVCKGFGGYDVFVSAADSRDMVSFGKTDANNCAGLKSFGSFNSAGATIEWRIKAGKPFAAILRWTVSIDPEDSSKHASWLVVSKLDHGSSCQMHYVAGSFVNANDAARKAADEKSASFNCDSDKPTFDSTIGPPNIDLDACKDLARE